MNRFTQAVVAIFLASVCITSTAFDSGKQPVHDFTRQWSIGGPSQWLQHLRTNPGVVFYVQHAPEHWIRESDLATLVSELDSDAPAGVVCYLASAHTVHADFESTVGREAAILVDAFRRKGPYPGSCSDLHAVDVGELRQWWTRQNR